MVTLTDREREVIVLLARGLTNGEIAKRLRISINTVESHLKRVKKRWDISTQAGLVGEAYRTGTIHAQVDLTPGVSVSAHKVIDAGYLPERSVEEWVNHPDALNDLINAMGGIRRKHRRAA
jgi:DNA-binding CsgD family transcriptional regulator